MAIMLVAFTSIFLVQSGSIKASEKARQMNVVGMLAKNAMVEAELSFEGKTFEEVKKTDSGTFPSPYETYSWKREIKEIDIPNLNINPNGGDQKGRDSGGDSSGSGNQMTEMLTKLLSQYLSKSIREVRVTVSWTQAAGEQKFTLATYWVNLNNDFQITQ